MPWLIIGGLGAAAWLVGELKGATRELKGSITWPVAACIVVGILALVGRKRR